MMDERTRSVAVKYLARLKKRNAEYDSECEQSYREDGLAPHYCIHGTNLWADYDPMCGPCEDAEGVYTEAIREAKRITKESAKRGDAMHTILTALMDASAPQSVISSVTSDVLNWVTAPTAWIYQDARKE